MTAPNVREKFAAYRKYLTSLGITPEILIERHQQTNKKTALVDSINSGEGMATSLVVLADWSHELGLAEKVAASITIVAYPEHERSLQNNSALRFMNVTSPPPMHGNAAGPTSQDQKALSFKVSCTIVPDPHALWMHANGEDQVQRQRAVPSYPITAWHQAPAAPDQTVIDGFLNDYRAATRPQKITTWRNWARTCFITIAR